MKLYKKAAKEYAKRTYKLTGLTKDGEQDFGAGVRWAIRELGLARFQVVGESLDILRSPTTTDSLTIILPKAWIEWLEREEEDA